MKEFHQISEAAWTRKKARQVPANSGFLKPADVACYFSVLERAHESVGDRIYGKYIALPDHSGDVTHQTPVRQPPAHNERINGYYSKLKPLIDGDLTNPFWTGLKGIVTSPFAI